MAANQEPQPIETAPKGQDALLWRTGRGWLIADWGDYYKYNGPVFTHWLPMPDPPNTESRKEPNNDN